MMIFGKNDPPAHANSRALVRPHTHGGLTSGSSGLMPRASHSGLSAPHVPLTHRQPRSGSMRAGVKSAAEHPQARRHLDPHHFTNLSDDAKRHEGRYGRAHVRNTTEQREANFYATKESSVEQPPGRECNLYLKSYYYTPLSKTDRTSPVPMHGGTDGFRADAQNTSAQLAEARLRRLKREHPQFQKEVDQVLRTQHNDYSIVDTEEKLSRKIAVADYAANSGVRVAQIEATTKYHGKPDLGSPAPDIERKAPYALGDVSRRTDTQLSPPSHVRLYKDRNRSSSPPEVVVKPSDRHLYEGPAPYDTEAVSGPAYPSPPAVGVQRGLYEKPTMVHIDSRQSRLCREDVDTLALKRARARSGASPSQERRSDPIFGSGSAWQAPRPRLGQRVEARWKAAEENNAAHPRTGKAFYPQSYPSTRLW